ncbi:MAG: rRNA (uracil1498-N3)-methyltransferase [Actinomycetota bacterium]|jgi:16S rRNA (uracil1498-N3)-methyltransferase|nr:rRNA (uracil1498-N3)-methyltransferase [Actinomycetota bacterium]
MANQYLSEELGAPAVGDTAVITGPEARHAVTVSRLAIGEQVRVGNGSGVVASGTVTAVAPGEFSFQVDVLQTIERPSPAIWLVQALAKGDRDELAIQAATELGVDGLIPWTASRSISRWEGAKVAKGQERWSAVVREATKQSARAWLPEVAPLVNTKQLAVLAEDARMIVLDPLAETSLISVEPDGRDIVLVVGPEGGISPAEFDTLYAAGAVGARLGDGILRTSTAGPAAIAVLSAKLGRWS